MGFTFKQFHIDDGLCAMKVGTDAILLGSWVAMDGAKAILDIGCGSGVLSIMLAQKSSPSTEIVAIDVDAEAVTQTRQNALASRWSSCIKVEHVDIQSFSQMTQRRFDLIVSNPPFFPAPEKSTNAYQTPCEQRHLARSSESLSPVELVESVTTLLSDDGVFYCVLPIAQADILLKIAAESGLGLCRRMTVSSKPDKAPIRRLMAFGFNAALSEDLALTIHDTAGGYSDDFRQLCQAYYLNF